jgi:hypothetical protein
MVASSVAKNAAEECDMLIESGGLNNTDDFSWEPYKVGVPDM